MDGDVDFDGHLNCGYGDFNGFFGDFRRNLNRGDACFNAIFNFGDGDLNVGFNEIDWDFSFDFNGGLGSVSIVEIVISFLTIVVEECEC
ncbi:uncharacterized protein J8A68_005559 [[Candida] subhashii]|uniref:Uncharacterized protein n=1 Tax=[Candida] subhashii TaxID=561895 RepID=A0A8J5Q2J8_9ASCO|nr:uncharacterized protein J8A68_005559 [[Candida] subhashii]KAG7660884.1 hypothetical protein J8A68_005559 [[Candida] subhashii]